MGWGRKPMLPVGEHRLHVQFCRFLNGTCKVSIVHQAVDREAEPVVRTFAQKSKALGDYTEKVCGKRLEVLEPAHRELLEGAYIWGVVKEGRNPGYRDLAAVIRREPNPNINRSSPVTDPESE